MPKFILKNVRKPKGFFGKRTISRMNENHAPLTTWALGLMDIRNEDVVLDIGCGGGEAIAKMATKAGKVMGLDYSPLSVKEAKKRNQEDMERGKVRIEEGSVSKLPFEDDTFTKVTAFETIYFWPDLYNDFREVLRVLRPGGRFYAILEMFEQSEGEGVETDAQAATKELEKAARVLMPGGVYAAAQDIYENSGRKEKHEKYVRDLGLYYPTKEALVAQFEAAGFGNVQVRVEEEKHWLMVSGEK